MTFNFAPWAIDGARTPSSLARVASYGASGGRSGVVRPTDLKVTALAVPGRGLRISAGSANVLNDYQTDPNQVYVVSNPAVHTVASATMPNAVATTAYYLVCVVVGDPEFNQTGHPFMPAGTLDPAVALTFEYVRVVVLPCSSSADHFDDLNKSYPGIALARLEIPANTTTVTNSMITDVRELAKPRSERRVLAQEISPFSGANGVTNAMGFLDWTNFKPNIAIPRWATKATIVVHMAGVLTMGTGSTNGFIRVALGNAAAAGVPYDEDPPAGGYSGGSKSTLVASGSFDVSTVAGTTQMLRMQIARDEGEAGYLTTWGGTQFIFDVQFDEDPI